MKLRSYQEDAVEIALRYPGFCLFKEQRTGKTATAVEIARRRDPRRLLVACPLIAQGVWDAHLVDVLPSCEIRLITHGTLWTQRKKLAKWAPDGIIVDESHAIGNRKSKQSKGARYISSRTAKRNPHSWRLALTGTPVDKAIEQAWAQFDFIDPTVFGTWKEFESRYLILGGFRGLKVVARKNLRDFYQRFSSRHFRIELDEARGKQTQIQEFDIRFELKESQALYSQMEADYMVTIRDTLITAQQAIAQSAKLRQLTSGFIIDREGLRHSVGYEKLSHLAALLRHLGPGKTVIMVYFIRDLELIQLLCQEMGFTSTLISGNNVFSGFNHDIAICQMKSGMAIDLSTATRMVFYSLDHSHRAYDQAKFRIRSFTSDSVSYYFLVATGTIDEDLRESLRVKCNFSQRLFNRYREGVNMVKKVSSQKDSQALDLTKELKEVVASIQTIQQENYQMENTPKKPAVKAAAKPAVKAAAKPAVKAAAKPAVKEALVTLAELTKRHKVVPSKARRLLRNGGIENPGRWAWKPESPALRKVEELLAK